MSRIGRTPIEIPASATVTVADKTVTIKGAKGQLEVALLPGIKVEVKDNQVLVSRSNDKIQTRANHGLIRSLVNNAIIGVSEGYKKTLKLVGTGYRVQAKGVGLDLSVGYSHTVPYQPVEGVKLTVEGNDTIHIEGIDKQAVGQAAANIRKIRPPEPYKGKGIRYADEVVKLKPGKAAV